MGIEGHQGTPEEIADAEDRLRYTMEGASSDIREALTDEERELVNVCDLRGGLFDLFGTIEGKEIAIQGDSRSSSRGERVWVGTFDGKKLNQEECEWYLKKYGKIAAYQMRTKQAANPQSHPFASIRKDPSGVGSYDYGEKDWVDKRREENQESA